MALINIPTYNAFLLKTYRFIFLTMKSPMNIVRTRANHDKNKYNHTPNPKSRNIKGILILIFS